ncbi:MAG: hypothetical protein R2710_11390 [Acidimicrobiales bacterium]
MALAEWLSITHHHQGIRVSVLCPQAVATNIVINSPDRGNAAMGDDGLETGVAAADGVVTSRRWRAIEAMRDETFWCCPIPGVATYVERKATDITLARRHAPLPGLALPRRPPPRRRHRPQGLSPPLRNQATTAANRRR